jgi:hypothetical protein
MFVQVVMVSAEVGHDHALTVSSPIRDVVIAILQSEMFGIPNTPPSFLKIPYVCREEAGCSCKCQPLPIGCDAPAVNDSGTLGADRGFISSCQLARDRWRLPQKKVALPLLAANRDRRYTPRLAGQCAGLHRTRRGTYQLCISRLSHASAILKSGRTVTAETSKVCAISSIETPPK